jgi:hypothetical protein
MRFKRWIVSSSTQLPDLVLQRVGVLHAGDVQLLERRRSRLGAVTVSICAERARRVGKHLATFKDLPPRQKPSSFSLDHVLEKLHEHAGGAK